MHLHGLSLQGLVNDLCLCETRWEIRIAESTRTSVQQILDNNFGVFSKFDT